MQQNIKERIVYLDLLRVVATFGVLVIHICGSGFYGCLFCPGWYIAVIYHSMARWSVPIFFMISGALFLNPQKTITYKDILTKYIPRLLIAYVFWSIVYYLIAFDGTFSIRKLCESSFHLWFLPVLMVVYLLIPVLRKIVLDKDLVQYLLVIWFVWSMIIMFPLPSHFVFLCFNDVLGYAGYFILGFFLSRTFFSNKQLRLIYSMSILGFLLTIVGTILIARNTQEANERMFGYLCPNVIVMSVGLFVLIQSKAAKCGNLVMRFVCFIRKDLFGIYLVHMVWFDVIMPIVRQFGGNAVFKLFMSPGITIIVFILSLYTTKIIRLIPIVRKVVE